MKYLILAFDGGGTRVILQWKLIARILEMFPQFLKSVSLYAGTSAGSILASALACGMAPYADKIFNVSMIDTVFYRSSLHAITSVNGLLSAKYENSGVKKLLENHFGAVNINDVPKSLFIPAFDTQGADQQRDGELLPKQHEHVVEEGAPSWMNTRCKRWHNIFFHNLADSIHAHDRLVSIIMKSCAAPYYFPMVSGCIDGGIAHNNPSLAALSHLLALGILLEDIYILSIGSGEKPQELEEIPNAALGLLQWMPYIMNMMFDANQEATSQSCHEILGKRFYRIQPVLQDAIPLDSINSVAQLEEIARNLDMSETFAWINKLLADTI